MNKFVLFTSLFTALRRNDFISVSPQITYGNKTLMLFSYFPGEKKKEMHICMQIIGKSKSNVFKCCHM
jgi:hypothetical protein